MSEQSRTPGPVELVRQLLDAASRKDGKVFDGNVFARFFAPDALFLTGVGRFEGRDAIRGYVEDFHSSYDELVFVADEVHDLGNGVAWFSAVATGRLRGTSADVHLHFAVVVTHAGGVVSQWTDYATTDEACAAAERLAGERGQAVSRENVEVARRAFEAWQNDDYEAWIALHDTDVEYLGAAERRLGQGVYRGHRGASELWRVWRDEVEGFWIESEQIRDLGDGRVVHLGQMGFRGSASGVDVDSELALVITLRGGKIVRSMDFMSHHEALKAVGLE